MKRPADVALDVERRLTRTWAGTVASEDEVPAWPYRFSLSQTSSRALEADFSAVVDAALDWREWVRGRDVELIDRGRRVGAITHSIPAQLVVPTIDEAARISGGDWQRRLQRGRDRVTQLRERFPNLRGLARLLRETDRFDDVDFELLLRAGEWFSKNSASGLTPRQVPLEGLHAKWLNTRQHLVALLAGIPGLGLVGNHPARIHFSYLDSEHLGRGGRRHDSATVGDTFLPAYAPKILVISENKDTAINFPQLPGAISVEGVGRGGGTIASFDWIINAPLVIYWGDMDADGLEILDGFRAAGVPARSILMDMAAFDRWERYGTDVDKRGTVLRRRDAREVPHLTEDEHELYFSLVSSAWSRARRIEQERIPLMVARDEVLAAAAESR